MKKLKAELDTLFWTTSGIRFIQSKRFEAYDRSFNHSIVIATFFLSAIAICYPFTGREENVLFGIIVSLLSILILILSLVIRSNKYTERAIRQHECGRKISKLMYGIKFINDLDELRKCSNEYGNILDNYENHSEYDHYYFLFRNRKNSNKKSKIINHVSVFLFAPFIHLILPACIPWITAIISLYLGYFLFS